MIKNHTWKIKTKLKFKRTQPTPFKKLNGLICTLDMGS